MHKVKILQDLKLLNCKLMLIYKIHKINTEIETKNQHYFNIF